MNVAEVIEELKKYPPYLPVRGFMSTVWLPNDPIGDLELHPTSEEAQEVTSIQWRGPDVVLDCDGMCL